MEKSNTTNAKFWAGGAREFNGRTNKNKIGTGFFAFLYRLLPFLNADEIDQRLFIKKAKSKMK
ncbi:MAG TPA: hypothetical protein PLV75_09205 [Saprospiraceae bacterium]|nr:hypothetical protein [Saprospiraceae bacterium]